MYTTLKISLGASGKKFMTDAEMTTHSISAPIQQFSYQIHLKFQPITVYCIQKYSSGSKEISQIFLG